VNEDIKQFLVVLFIFAAAAASLLVGILAFNAVLHYSHVWFPLAAL